MTRASVQDAIARGNGRAAAVLGGWCDAYRADGARAPLAAARRYLRLRAAFFPEDGRAGADGVWRGVFDSAYTRVGDYLAGDGVVWFVAVQAPMVPVLCVRTNRVLRFSRPATEGLAGVGRYGGVDRAAAVTVLEEWPGCVLSARGGGIQAGLPGDAGDAAWHVALPVLPEGVELRAGDLMRDEVGRAGVVVAAEMSALGWRLLVRQAAG